MRAWTARAYTQGMDTRTFDKAFIRVQDRDRVRMGARRETRRTSFAATGLMRGLSDLMPECGVAGTNVTQLIQHGKVEVKAKRVRV